jgi:hypothetical protein
MAGFVVYIWNEPGGTNISNRAPLPGLPVPYGAYTCRGGHVIRIFSRVPERVLMRWRLLGGFLRG